MHYCTASTNDILFEDIDLTGIFDKRNVGVITDALPIKNHSLIFVQKTRGYDAKNDTHAILKAYTSFISKLETTFNHKIVFKPVQGLKGKIMCHTKDQVTLTSFADKVNNLITDASALPFVEKSNFTSLLKVINTRCKDMVDNHYDFSEVNATPTAENIAKIFDKNMKLQNSKLKPSVQITLDVYKKPKRIGSFLPTEQDTILNMTKEAYNKLYEEARNIKVQAKENISEKKKGKRESKKENKTP